MDFVTYLPRTIRGHDVIWVVVDRLTKSVNFLAMNLRMSMEKFAQFYIREIVRLYGAPSSITIEKVKLIQERMRASQTRQKSYVDRRRRPLEFVVGDHVFLRLTPTSVGRAIRSRKLSLRFIGLYQILRRVGLVAYEIAIPPQLVNHHLVFHVSQLRKYVLNSYQVLEVKDVHVRNYLSVEVQLVKIVESQTKQLRGKTVSLVGVGWDSRTCDSTWELDQSLVLFYEKILKDLKKEFCCNGNVVQDKELGKIIQLQGDQRKNVSHFLIQAGLVRKDQIKIHGF
ncbi:uncharacterized protein LOC108330300 [Vigna angularis]|uniref:uncharacterized protein LOC108330300 n=1 Tax=Phaseolus angularis TaxID=3914 RepID=UPI000809C21D|nr:uncharacterized protein LOC108330300 [Vigna angularis]